MSIARKVEKRPSGDLKITVVVRDSAGLAAEETFRITRRLRFFETRAFLPAVLGSAFGLIGLGLGIPHVGLVTGAFSGAATLIGRAGSLQANCRL